MDKSIHIIYNVFYLIYYCPPFLLNGVANIYDRQVTVSFFSLLAQLTDSVSQGLAETFQNEPDLTNESLIFIIK